MKNQEKSLEKSEASVVQPVEKSQSLTDTCTVIKDQIKDAAKYKPTFRR
jgi:hypothetical protein